MNRDLLAADLERDEDLRLFPYDDATGKQLKQGDKLIGKLSIGIGRNLTDNGISKSEALMLCAANIDGVLADLDRRLPWWRQMSEARQRALANAAFNMGIDRLCGFIKALGFLKEGDYNRAADEFLNSRWAQQTGQRALRIADLIRKG